MAIRPILHGPLADNVTGRIASGYLYVTALTSVNSDYFNGADPAPLTQPIQTNLNSGTGYIWVPFIAGGDKFPGGEFGGPFKVLSNSTRLSGKTQTGYVAILSGLDPFLLESDLSLTHSVIGIREVSRSLDDTLTLTNDVVDSYGKSDDLSFSHTVEVTLVKFFDLSDSIAFTTDVKSGEVIEDDFSDDLTFSDSVESSLVYERSVSDSIGLSHSVSLNIIKFISFSDTMSLTSTEADRKIPLGKFYQEAPLQQTVVVKKPYRLSLSSDLNLTDNAIALPYYVHLSHTLALTQEAFELTTKILNEHSLELSQEVLVNLDRTFEIVDTLALTHFATKAEFFELDHTLSFTHSASALDELAQVLSFSDSVTVDVSKLFIQDVGVDQTLVLNLVKFESLTHTINLGHSAICIKSGFSTCGYNPISTVLPAAPTLVKAATVTYSQDTNTLTLKAPAIGDSEDRTYQRVLRETSGGTLKGYRQTSWPKTRTLNYTFNDLDCDQIDDIQAFLRATLGLEVTLVDYWGRTWTGVIINPDTAYEDASRTTRTVTLSFQGVLQ